MEERIRDFVDFARYATDMIVLMEGDRRATQEAMRRLEESMRRLEESMRRLEESTRRLDGNANRRDEVMQRLLQSVAVMQAEIVRIDETHS